MSSLDLSELSISELQKLKNKIVDTLNFKINQSNKYISSDILKYNILPFSTEIQNYKDTNNLKNCLQILDTQSDYSKYENYEYYNINKYDPKTESLKYFCAQKILDYIDDIFIKYEIQSTKIKISNIEIYFSYKLDLYKNIKNNSTFYNIFKLEIIKLSDTYRLYVYRYDLNEGDYINMSDSGNVSYSTYEFHMFLDTYLNFPYIEIWDIHIKTDKFNKIKNINQIYLNSNFSHNWYFTNETYFSRINNFERERMELTTGSKQLYSASFYIFYNYFYTNMKFQKYVYSYLESYKDGIILKYDTIDSEIAYSLSDSLSLNLNIFLSDEEYIKNKKSYNIEFTLKEITELKYYKYILEVLNVYYNLFSFIANNISLEMYNKVKKLTF